MGSCTEARVSRLRQLQRDVEVLRLREVLLSCLMLILGSVLVYVQLIDSYFE